LKAFIEKSVRESLFPYSAFGDYFADFGLVNPLLLGHLFEQLDLGLMVAENRWDIEYPTYDKYGDKEADEADGKTDE